MSKKVANKWEEKKIGSLGKVVTGKTPPKAEDIYWNGDELFVSPKDMERDSLYIYKTQSTITDLALKKFKTQVIPRNSVMYTALSFGFGKIGIASKELITNQQINSIVVNEKNDYRFIYYLLRVNTPYIFTYNSGIETPFVPKSVFEKIKLLVPQLPTQQKIADILSAYDELIENNNRRIELLEEAAENLYKEWFVRFRFPDYKKTKFENGLPKGWAVVKLGELYSTMSGGTPSRKNQSYYINGNYQWIKTGELNDRFIIETEEKITEEAIDKSSAKLFEKGSLLMAMYGATIGKLGFATNNATCNQACCVLNPRFSEYTNEYLLLYLLSNREYITNIGFGAAQQNLSQDLIKNIKLLKPDGKLVNEFSNLIKPIYMEIRNLQIQNCNLIKQRDMLLPHLMSGKLEI